MNVLGVITFFWVRFTNRTDKTKEPDLIFWFKDNYEQLIAVVLLDIGLMVLRSDQGLSIDFTQLAFLPSWLQMVGDLAFCWVIGLGGAWLAYAGYKKAIIDNR